MEKGAPQFHTHPPSVAAKDHFVWNWRIFGAEKEWPFSVQLTGVWNREAPFWKTITTIFIQKLPFCGGWGLDWFKVCCICCKFGAWVGNCCCKVIGTPVGKLIGKLIAGCEAIWTWFFGTTRMACCWNWPRFWKAGKNFFHV